MKTNWFNTLAEALDAEDLQEHWDGHPINYDQTFTRLLEIDGRFHYVSITRDDKGMYERPIHYDAGSIARWGRMGLA